MLTYDYNTIIKRISKYEKGDIKTGIILDKT